MTRRLVVASIALLGLLLIPAVGLAWEVARPGFAGAGGAAACPVMERTACPKSAGNELAKLAMAAEQGCPASEALLIEKAQGCADAETAKLARRAAAGDEGALVELTQRIKALAPVPTPAPADPANVA